MGTVLAWSGKYDASIENNELAQKVNPQDPTIFFRHFGLALAHYLAGRCDRALVHASAVAQTRPAWWPGRRSMRKPAESGQIEDGRRIVAEMKRARPGLDTSALAGFPSPMPRTAPVSALSLDKSGVGELTSDAGTNALLGG